MERCSTLPSRRRKTQLRDSRHCAGDELCQLLSQLTVDAWQQRPGCKARRAIHITRSCTRNGSEKILRGVRKKQLAKRWGVLCLCLGLRPRPNRCSLASGGLTGAAPAAARAKASACYRFRGYRGASASAVYASRVMLPSPMQDSLPAGWLAFTGRESNPLGRGERFPSFYISSPFPGFILTLRCSDSVRLLGCFCRAREPAGTGSC
jgi:hypothetical protein